MELLLTIFSGLLILFSLLPFSQHQHWIFRAAEFIKLQLLFLQSIVFILSFFLIKDRLTLWILQSIQLALMAYHAFILMRYTKFWRSRTFTRSAHSSRKIKIISCNIYLFNKEYHRFIELINKERPDIFLTIESNSDWERALRPLEAEYPEYEKVSLENTYGMHLYTKLKMNKVRTHYFVSDDLPSIEAELETEDGYRFVFFGVHPPPPSPTEEENSKERDGDLLSVAKRVRDYQLPVVITGDFNNVAWARSSVLFKKTSKLIDARIGRGILSTFHARYWFFRVPLDLLFHSSSIFIDKLLIYPSIGSDHFPVGCTFHIDRQNDAQEEDVKSLEAEEMEEVDDLIREGEEEESEQRKRR